MRRTPTDAELLSAILSGKRGPVHYRYKLYRSNISGEQLDELPGVQGARISLSNFTDATWKLEIPLRRTRQLDVFKDYVKAVIEVRDGSSWRPFPMGLYLFEAPTGTLRPTFSDWNLVGRSPESLLLLSSAYAGYGVAAGTGMLAAARSVLYAQGVPSSRIDFPATDVALSSAMFFDPVTDPAGSVWLRVVNALLAAGGFYAVYCDAEGRFKTRKIDDLGRRQEDVSYDSSWVVARGGARLQPEVEETFDDERFANRVVVYSGDPNISPPVVSVAENHDPQSRGSIENLGRVVQKEPIVLKSIATAADADLVARSELKKASSLARKLTFATLPDPRRGPREVYRVDLSGPAGEVLVDSTWAVTGWTLPLDLSEMVHTVARNIAV